jgi:Zn-dependent protease with chaperone function
MDQAAFAQLIARVERDSLQSPRRYQLKVAMLAMAGFGVLAVVVGMAGLGLFLLTGGVISVALMGAGAAVLILKLGKLLILLAWPMWYLVKSSISALFTRLPSPQGHEITREQAPVLFLALDDMRARMKGPRFHHVLITDDLNAAVLQRPFLGLFGWPRNYLILGLPLLETFTPHEAQAVVAHEYGHLAGSHSRFAAYIYRLRNSWGSIEALAHGWQGWTSTPLKKLVGWFAPYFNAYTFVLARTNEYQADLASAELVGADVAASALKRVQIVAACRQAFMQDVADAMSEQPRPPGDLMLRWADFGKQAPLHDDAPRWLKDAFAQQPGLTDTHPALTQRVQALLKGREQSVEILPSPIDGASAAQAWLGKSLDVLRHHLQREWQERVLQGWAERHQTLQGQKARLAELEAMAELDRDQSLEVIRLRMQLRPKEGPYLAALSAFNQQHPDHALGLFLEGQERLEQGDDAGLALLERTMALDADATKPACECAVVFLRKRGEEQRAEAFVSRWREKDALEHRQMAEIQALDPKHDIVVDADLPQDTRQIAAQRVAELGWRVKQAYLVRRTLPSAPQARCHVLILTLRWPARLLRHHSALIQKLAKQEWPLQLHICTVHASQYKVYKAKLPGLAKARLK